MRKVSLRRNMVANALLTLSSAIFPLITFPYLSRVLLPAGVGKIYFATSLASYFAMFAQAGIPVYGVRLCARLRDDRAALSRAVYELLRLNVLLSLPVLLTYAAAIALVPRLYAERNLLAVVGIGILLNAVNTEWLYQALERYTYIAVRSLICKAIALFAMLMLVRGAEDYVLYGGISVFALSASSLWNLLRLRRHVSYVPIARGDLPASCRKHLRPALNFFLLAVMTTVYTNLDVVMLGLMKEELVVGCYGTAVKIKLGVVALITSCSGVLMPRASYFVETGQRDALERVLRRMMAFALLLALGLALYGVLFAPEIVRLLAGSAYRGAVLPLRILMMTPALIAVSHVLGMEALIPLGRENVVVHAVCGGALLDLLLNLLLIPSRGAAGAALATLAAEGFVLAYLYLRLRGEELAVFGNVAPLRMMIALACSAAAGWCGGLAGAKMSSAPFVVPALSGVAFFAVYGAMLLLLREPLVRELWQKGKGRT